MACDILCECLKPTKFKPAVNKKVCEAAMFVRQEIHWQTIEMFD